MHYMLRTLYIRVQQLQFNIDIATTSFPSEVTLYLRELYAKEERIHCELVAAAIWDLT